MLSQPPRLSYERAPDPAVAPTSSAWQTESLWREQLWVPGMVSAPCRAWALPRRCQAVPGQEGVGRARTSWALAEESTDVMSLLHPPSGGRGKWPHRSVGALCVGSLFFCVSFPKCKSASDFRTPFWCKVQFWHLWLTARQAPNVAVQLHVCQRLAELGYFQKFPDCLGLGLI